MTHAGEDGGGGGCFTEGGACAGQTQRTPPHDGPLVGPHAKQGRRRSGEAEGEEGREECCCLVLRFIGRTRDGLRDARGRDRSSFQSFRNQRLLLFDVRPLASRLLSGGGHGDARARHQRPPQGRAERGELVRRGGSIGRKGGARSGKRLCAKTCQWGEHSYACIPRFMESKILNPCASAGDTYMELPFGICLRCLNVCPPKTPYCLSAPGPPETLVEILGGAPPGRSGLTCAQRVYITRTRSCQWQVKAARCPNGWREGA